MPIYIDTNVFYNAYCPIEDRFAADWLLKQMDPEFPGINLNGQLQKCLELLKSKLI